MQYSILIVQNSSDMKMTYCPDYIANIYFLETSEFLMVIDQRLGAFRRAGSSWLTVLTMLILLTVLTVQTTAKVRT